MASKLITRGIDNLVKRLELAELGRHIAATLRALTSRKREDILGEPLSFLGGRYREAYFHEADAIHGSRELPRMKSSRVQDEMISSASNLVKVSHRRPHWLPFGTETMTRGLRWIVHLTPTLLVNPHLSTSASR